MMPPGWIFGAIMQTNNRIIWISQGNSRTSFFDLRQGTTISLVALGRGEAIAPTEKALKANRINTRYDSTVQLRIPSGMKELNDSGFGFLTVANGQTTLEQLR